MPKHIDSEILAVLRQYRIADESSSKKSITDIKQHPERMLSRLVSFRFDRKRYFLLFDNAVGDDEAAVLNHIAMDEPLLPGELVRNPIESEKGHGMPYKGKDVYLYAVAPTSRRLDHELVDRYPDISRSTVQKYIKAGYVTINGEVQTRVNSDITASDVIAMTPPAKMTYEQDELPVIYLDDDVIVINKPSGILTHSKGVLNEEFTVADFFRRYTTWGLDTNRAGIVHRLDRDTSGIIIGARNERAAAVLKKQFADRTTKKTYRAIIDGQPKQAHAVIDLPIGRNPSAPSTFRVDSSGKPAQTTYEVIRTSKRYSEAVLQPRTGRTHQLRVHMAYILTPIHGDKVYGGKKGERLYLHAESLEITLPEGKRTTFAAPVPGSFDQVMAK